jgi:hypothetical protein
MGSIVHGPSPTAKTICEVHVERERMHDGERRAHAGRMKAVAGAKGCGGLNQFVFRARPLLGGAVCCSEAIPESCVVGEC